MYSVSQSIIWRRDWQYVDFKIAENQKFLISTRYFIYIFQTGTFCKIQQQRLSRLPGNKQMTILI